MTQKWNSSIFVCYISHLEGWQSLAECTGLENQQGFTPFGGSNPSPSAQVLLGFNLNKITRIRFDKLSV